MEVPMFIQSFFKSLTSTSTRRQSARWYPPTSRRWLEVLEDRCLLSLTPAVNYPVALNPSTVVAADFNSDGHLDLATANTKISVLLGNADGTFQAAQDSAGPGSSVAVGDF